MLRGLQSLLVGSTIVRVEHDVYDFLVTDRRALAGVVPANDHRELDEELLLAETADGAGVALYIDPAVLGRLEDRRSAGRVDRGKSRRLLHGTRGRQPLRLLDLAARVRCARIALGARDVRPRWTSTPRRFFSWADQQGGGYPAQVHARLFDRVEFDARLEPEQFDRYRTAHRCAANFCRRLERRFVSRGSRQDRADGARAAQVLSPRKRGEASVRDLVSELPARGMRRQACGPVAAYSSSSGLLVSACFLSCSQSLSLRRSFFFGGGPVRPSLPLS